LFLLIHYPAVRGVGVKVIQLQEIGRSPQCVAVEHVKYPSRSRMNGRREIGQIRKDDEFHARSIGLLPRALVAGLV
jgi:hypothetical protein